MGQNFNVFMILPFTIKAMKYFNIIDIKFTFIDYLWLT